MFFIEICHFELIDFFLAIALTQEMATGRDRINRVLYVEMDGSLRFEPMPS
jgi:hypothetical protein